MPRTASAPMLSAAFIMPAHEDPRRPNRVEAAKGSTSRFQINALASIPAQILEAREHPQILARRGAGLWSTLHERFETVQEDAAGPVVTMLQAPDMRAMATQRTGKTFLPARPCTISWAAMLARSLLLPMPVKPMTCTWVETAPGPSEEGRERNGKEARGKNGNRGIVPSRTWGLRCWKWKEGKGNSFMGSDDTAPSARRQAGENVRN
jgi:hypothetical protein